MLEVAEAEHRSTLDWWEQTLGVRIDRETLNTLTPDQEAASRKAMEALPFIRVPLSSLIAPETVERFKSLGTKKITDPETGEILEIEELDEKYTADEFKALVQRAVTTPPEGVADLPAHLQELRATYLSLQPPPR